MGYSEDQLFLLPPSLHDWVSDDDFSHFILEAVEHVDMSAFHVSRTGSGKAHDDERAPSAVKADKPINLTDADSAIRRKSVRHEYQQAYHAQAAVDADGTMLVVATDVLSTPNDRAGIEVLLDEMEG